MEEKIPLMIICGPTASGKTALSVALAKKMDSEIISIDSMQVYKKMDIGTAKPSLEEREGIVHHMIDVADANEDFDVVKYCTMAKKVIADIYSRGKIPILVGGTGLYINTLVDNITFFEVACDRAYRKELEAFAKEHGAVALHEKLKSVDEESYLFIHPNNLPRVIRALEVFHLTGTTIGVQNKKSKEIPSPYHPCIIGLNYEDRGVLYERIDKRVDLMMAQGLEEEVRALANNLSLEETGELPPYSSMQAIGYKELLLYFKGDTTREQAIAHIKQESRRYAKRQLTWFRRNEKINWILLNETTTKADIIKKATTLVNAHFGCDRKKENLA